jgi:hypothetical protein
LINGRDLLALGLEPGPSFKTILDAVQSQQLEGTLRTHDDALAFVRRGWLSQPPETRAGDASQ